MDEGGAEEAHNVCLGRLQIGVFRIVAQHHDILFGVVPPLYSVKGVGEQSS